VSPLSSFSLFSLLNMTDEQAQPVSIVFRTPTSEAPPFHLRSITEVPQSKAVEIAEDFAKQGRESERSPYRLYRLGEEEDKRLLALDFTEVVAVLIGDDSFSESAS